MADDGTGRVPDPTTATRAFTVITTYANKIAGELHDQMPMVPSISGRRAC